MANPRNKLIYKVISLFIKSAILFFSFYYIIFKLRNASQSFDAFDLSTPVNILFIVCIFLLMIVNWGIETRKWQLLAAPLERVSFLIALKGVLSGITISIFTPNRVGEFAGRVFYLKTEEKLRATVLSLIGSSLQFAVTVVAGIIAFFFLEKKYYDFFRTEEFISTDMLLILVLLFAALLVLLFFILKKRSGKLRNYLEVFKLLDRKSLNSAVNLSILRYVVFSVQYYLALKIFGIGGGEVILFSLIAVTFFVNSVVPSFALTEIATRSGVAIYFFGMISDAHAGIFAASLFLWIVNLAIPALAGAAFVNKLKFFRE